MRKYILDSNVFMMPARQYYAFDIAPAYWEKLLGTASQNQNIILLDVVKDEIYAGADALKEWLSEHEKEFVSCDHRTDIIIKNYAEIINYIRTCGLYTNAGFEKWTPENIADPWLIAAAKANGFIIVTNERTTGNLSKNNPTGKIKIPDVADYFNVETMTLFDMMRDLKIKI